jgi:hypothetical protein
MARLDPHERPEVGVERCLSAFAHMASPQCERHMNTCAQQYRLRKSACVTCMHTHSSTGCVSLPCACQLWTASLT